MPDPSPAATRVGAWAVRAAAAATSLLLLGTLAACDGDVAPAVAPSPVPSASASEEPRTAAAPPPPPTTVRVTRVSGRLGPQDARVLAKRIGAVVTGYFDDAFLGGAYPRSDFGGAFATFTEGRHARPEGPRTC